MKRANDQSGLLKMLKREKLSVSDLARAFNPRSPDWKLAKSWVTGDVEPKLSTIGKIIEALRKKGHSVSIADFLAPAPAPRKRRVAA